jgi:hypothetical protein
MHIDGHQDVTTNREEALAKTVENPFLVFHLMG